MLHSLYTSISQEQHQFDFGKYQFAFSCYKHSESNHLCVVSNNEVDPKYMDCVEEGNDPVLMKSEHLIWYGKVSVLNFMLSFFKVILCNCLTRSLTKWSHTQVQVRISLLGY